MQFLLLLLTLGVLACADKQAYHDKITEGPCKSRYPWGGGVDFRHVAHRNWWVLMTSKHLAYHLGLQFLGNDSLSESQFQKLCLRFNDDGIFSLLDPDNILLECNMQGNAMFWMSCHFPDSRLPALGELKATVVWGDERHRYVLIVLCALESSHPYWLLISKFPLLLEDGIQTKVLDIVSNLGFNNQHVLYLLSDVPHCNAWL